MSYTRPLGLVAVIALGAGCGSELEGRAPSNETDTVEADLRDTEAEVDDTSVTPDVEVDAGDADVGGDTVTPLAQWETFGIGDVGRIDSVVLASANLGFAASGPRVLRWDGRSFGPYGEPGREGDDVLEVHGVAVTGETVWAVGEAGLVARRPVSGGTWERVTSPLTVDLWAVSVREDVIFVAGDDGTIARFSSDSWETLFTSTTIDLRAMWIDPKQSGDDGVFAVGSGGQLVTRVSTTWKATQIASSAVILRDILGLANGTLVAVGNRQTITVKRPEAPAWQGQATNDARERDLTALTLSKDGKLRAYGVDGAILLQDGNVWSVETDASGVAQLEDFAAADTVPGSSALIALGSDGGGVRFDGTAWTQVSTSPSGAITDLANDGETLYATGDKGLFAVRGPSGWSAIPTPFEGDFHAVAAEDGVAYAVGAGGAIVRYEEGVATIVETPIPLDLFGVALQDGNVYACGRGGTLLVIEGGNATVRATGTTADLRDIIVGGDGRLWLSGSFGTLLRVPATGLPVPVLSGVGGNLNGLASTTDGVLVAGDNGVILLATADGATLEHEAPGAFLYAIATSPAGALAVGANGLVLARDGTTWTPEVVAERAATFESAWIDTSGEAIIGGILRDHHLESRLEPIE